MSTLSLDAFLISHLETMRRDTFSSSSSSFIFLFELIFAAVSFFARFLLLMLPLSRTKPNFRTKRFSSFQTQTHRKKYPLLKKSMQMKFSERKEIEKTEKGMDGGERRGAQLVSQLATARIQFPQLAKILPLEIFLPYSPFLTLHWCAP